MPGKLYTCESAAEQGGYIKSILDSCNEVSGEGEEMCYSVAYYYGSVTDISSSCNGAYGACR